MVVSKTKTSRGKTGGRVPPSHFSSGEGVGTDSRRLPRNRRREDPKRKWKTRLRSKRFRGAWGQRKTEERDFRCFVRAKNGAKAKTYMKNKDPAPKLLLEYYYFITVNMKSCLVTDSHDPHLQCVYKKD